MQAWHCQCLKHVKQLFEAAKGTSTALPARDDRVQVRILRGVLRLRNRYELPGLSGACGAVSAWIREYIICNTDMGST